MGGVDILTKEAIIDRLPLSEEKQAIYMCISNDIFSPSLQMRATAVHRCCLALGSGYMKPPMPIARAFLLHVLYSSR
jgi:hypothetical protein